MDSVPNMMQAPNRMFSYNMETFQYSELIAKLMQVFLNVVNSYIYSRWAGTENDTNIIKEQLLKGQTTLKRPHWQIATLLTRQATENRTLLQDKLHVLAAIQPIILITSYAATFREHIIAIHNPLEEAEEEEEITIEITVNNNSQG